MNYHIIPQDKFFETYIEDIYRIHQEDNNVIWVRGDKGDSPFFHTVRPVEYIGRNIESLEEHIHQIKPEDRLFVARYDTFLGNILLKTNLAAPLYVYLMGADFYAQPEWWHEKWLLDPKTKRIIKKYRLYPVIFPKRKPWRWYRWIGFLIHLHQQYNNKKETIKRIDYLVLPEHDKGEFNLVKQLYPGFKADFRIGTFNQNFDLAKDRPLKQIPLKEDSLRILLGNSADPSGNQIDAIHFLKNNLHIPYEVFCLLSYGDQQARSWIMDYGVRELGDRFRPVTDYMERSQYIDFLNDMDLVVMFHNRQQAAGTVMTALALGKPVFIKSRSPLFCQLESMGVQAFFDIRELSTHDPIQTIRNTQAIRQDTLDRISLEYSESTRLDHLRKLLN